MREIKFRGLTIDGKVWVYGSLLQIDYHNSIDYVITTQIVLPNCHEYDVDPATVGQYSGLQDKNGKEIFEGDIVEFYIDGDKNAEMAQGIVRYSERRAAFMFKVDEIVSVLIGLNIPHSISCFDDANNCKVIGNIYENSNLLDKPDTKIQN
jgi:uncharacterized phage protein (TIGR01671 family)